VPVEGVVHALRRIHAALVPRGAVIDTQPVVSEPIVEAGGQRLGTLDMREWRATIDAVDARIAETVDAGLFAIENELWCVVADEFDSGGEFLDVVSGWAGTRIPVALAERADSESSQLRVLQDVRVRLLRRLPTA
jgi:hypothetical protein